MTKEGGHGNRADDDRGHRDTRSAVVDLGAGRRCGGSLEVDLRRADRAGRDLRLVPLLQAQVLGRSASPSRLATSGGVAERLGRGLQSPVLRFESGRRLQETLTPFVGPQFWQIGPWPRQSKLARLGCGSVGLTEAVIMEAWERPSMGSTTS